MATRGEWLSAEVFGSMAGLTRRSATRIIAAALEGRPWRGRLLEVRRVLGRGGKAGLCYEVSLNSLSEALEGDLSDPSEWHEPRPASERRPALVQSAIVDGRWTIIREAADLPPRSGARAAAVQRAAKLSGKAARTIERWLAQYDAHGFHGLARRRPSNAGVARTHVSRAFDRACRDAGYSDDLIEQIGVHIDARIRAIWASRAEAAGVTDVQLRAEHELWKACRAHGVDVPEAAMRLSRRHVERFVQFRQVNIHRNNRKAFEDGKPRITRDWTVLAPMDRIVADVKHLDVIVRRPDGSEAWPKIVGFHDAATGRAFLYPLLLPAGTGVRREHVIEAFIAMVSDPAWGFPKGLYLDNGGEFACFEQLRPALSLVNQEAGREIIYAKPYNASAKTVENTFKRLDAYLFSSLPGYAGSDRMCKKTQTVGKPPAPWTGDWESFCTTVTGLLIAFNARPYRRQDGAASASERFRAKVEAGWRATLVEPHLLDAAFCTRETRIIDRGALRIEGRRYHNEDLHRLGSRTTVTVALPWRRGAMPLFQGPNGVWSQLEEDAPYNPEWKEGARDAGRRQRRYEAGAKALAAAAGDYDPVVARLEMAARYAPVQLQPGADRLGASSELIALADGRQAGRARQQENTDEATRRQRREAEETLRLERMMRHAG